MGETVFLDEAGVTVTQARFVHGAQTFAMSNVTSVGSARTDPSRRGPIVLVVLGVVLILAHQAASIAFGVLLAGLGAWWYQSQKPTHVVLLRSASGESRAFSSKDKTQVDRIVAAVNSAIVARG